MSTSPKLLMDESRPRSLRDSFISYLFYAFLFERRGSFEREVPPPVSLASEVPSVWIDVYRRVLRETTSSVEGLQGCRSTSRVLVPEYDRLYPGLYLTLYGFLYVGVTSSSPLVPRVPYVPFPKVHVPRRLRDSAGFGEGKSRQKGRSRVWRSDVTSHDRGRSPFLPSTGAEEMTPSS